MIPKIIHLCWLSKDDYPACIQKCIDSWQEHLRDYEIWVWDTERFDLSQSKWVEQAFEAHKYAFAADYIRLYALYNYGGIYLDSDVMVYKNFDDLLHLPYFIGEDYTHCFEPAIIGAEPGLQWLRDVLDRYEGLPFKNEDGSYNMRGLPVIFYDRLVPKYRFRRISMPCNYPLEEGIIRIMPACYFNSRDFVGIIKTDNSYCSHNYAGAWLKEQSKIKVSVKRILPRYLLLMFYNLRSRFLRSTKPEHAIPYDV